MVLSGASHSVSSTSTVQAQGAWFKPWSSGEDGGVTPPHP